MSNVLKRFLSVIISASVCLCTFVYAEGGKEISKDTLTSMYFLRELGIIGEYYDYNTDIGEQITRAEYADVVAKTLNVKNTVRTDTYFYDVPPAHFACAQINALAEMGFINGVGENRFEPDSYITTAAACKILLSIMGYDTIATANGGYPNGYLEIARRLELLDGVSGSDILTRGDMMLIVFEAMKAPMYSARSFTGDNIGEYEMDEDKTILKVYRNSYWGEGVLDGARMSSLNGTVLTENEVEIDGDVYGSRVDLYNMLGEEIEYIAYSENDDDNGEVLLARTTGDSEVINISAAQFENFDKDTYRLSYTVDNKTKTVTIERGMQLIYNGSLITKNASDRINEGCDLKLVKDKDGYNTVIAKKKKNYVVKSIDVFNEIVTNLADSPKMLRIESDKRDYVGITKVNTGEIAIDGIAQDDVLTVYESYYEAPQEYGNSLEIIVTSERITGIVESVSNSDDGALVKVNGVVYKDVSGLKYSAGENTVLYLDADGEIAYAKSAPTSDFAAYLMKGNVIDDGEVYDEILSLKMLKQTGEIVIMQCSQKIEVDGKRVDSAKAAYSKLCDPDSADSVFMPQLVLIKTDDSGLVSSIDTAGGYDGEGTLRISLERASMMYKGTGYIGNNSTNIGAINANTVTFRVPTKAMLESGEADDDDYGIGSSGYIGDNDWITATTYKTTEKKADIEEFMVAELSGSASSIPWPVLIENTAQIFDSEEGGVMSTVVGYDGYAKVNIPIKDDAQWKNKGASWNEGSFDNLKPGMVIAVNKNSKGHAISVDIIYDPDNREHYYYSGDYNAMMNEVGIAEEASASLLVLKLPGNDRSIAVKPDSAEILVFDKNLNSNQIYKGTFMDANLYDDSYDKTNPETYSDVVVFQWQRWPRRVYIFK